MSFLIVFLVIWIAAPGPIALLTLNRSRGQGFAAGLAVAVGAAATTTLILGIVTIVNLLNISIAQFSTSRLPQIFGALLIIMLGVHAGYKAFMLTETSNSTQPNKHKSCVADVRKQRRNVAQGMLVAMSGIPQSIIFYIILIPQTVAVDQIGSVTLAFGLSKIVLTLFCYTAIAGLVSYADSWLHSPKVGQRFDFATAIFMVGFGINILV